MNRVLIVTGGSRGIGAATARLAGERGYQVAVGYLQDERAANAVVESIAAKGGNAVAVRVDVSRESDVLRLFETVDNKLGRLTTLVNCAGIVDLKMRLDQMTAARLERMFSVNVIGTMLCAAEGIRRLSTARGGPGGSIVNVSSAASRHGSAGEYVDYAASKAAIDTLTIGLAKEVALEGIRVNAVRPGVIATEIHASSGDPERAQRLAPSLPLQRPGTAEEVARAILWLASDEASYCTGSIVDVAGGR
jgi:NAD(P)-dependent dehydrogenase (short-subunit alcohol dehydrogenase family)